MNRGRRLRSGSFMRELVRENKVMVEDLIYPLFVVHGENIKKEIEALPNNYHYSIDRLPEIIKEISDLGIKGIILFGLPEKKDECGCEAYDTNGIVQRAVRKIKEINKELLVITDVCMCQYTSHGHCGILNGNDVNNDETLNYISKIALSHVEAGADMVAPSDMMDGRIGHIRHTLDQAGYVNTPIMSYAVKFASAFYGPFREAANSAPSFGDRKTYQMDPANRREAIKEALWDVEEGADIVMVKPALSYLDLIRDVKERTNIPVAAYSVSGEYSMIKLAGKQGLIDEERIMMETLVSMKRAGADIIITYFALDAARILRGE